MVLRSGFSITLWSWMRGYIVVNEPRAFIYICVLFMRGLNIHVNSKMDPDQYSVGGLGTLWEQNMAQDRELSSRLMIFCNRI